jgi:hypothetical protein
MPGIMFNAPWSQDTVRTFRRRASTTGQPRERIVFVGGKDGLKWLPLQPPRATRL